MIKDKAWSKKIKSLLIFFMPLIIGTGAVHQYYDIQLRKSDQIISIRQQMDPIVVNSFKLIDEYRLILDKYPDVLFQDTEHVAFMDTKAVGFAKISKEDEEKLDKLEKRLNLLKENFQVYENQLAKHEDRAPRDINEIVPIELN